MQTIIELQGGGKKSKKKCSLKKRSGQRYRHLKSKEECWNHESVPTRTTPKVSEECLVPIRGGKRHSKKKRSHSRRRK